MIENFIKLFKSLRIVISFEMLNSKENSFVKYCDNHLINYT